MRRSVLLLLMSAIVLGVASSLDSEDSDYNHLSGQQLYSGVEQIISKRAARDTSSSTFEDLTDGVDELVRDNMESVMESSSGDVRYRNLYLLAHICPDADFSELENGSTISSRIEIRDMYAICNDLPRKHSFF
ncbi:uncharacterized protein LOC6529976 [Drosophila yakuba]|uniref:Uncharacterized protein n=1 Tax=Drosophila yakuba TaxID=7245 RepID=B4P4J5_DROYA|nr:uncharacterized protein LOC6529976 [Drosophila yakuba]EDW90634.1 uncharacterized protein Dyak_GE12532 [Drosophila yakuba]